MNKPEVGQTIYAFGGRWKKDNVLIPWTVSKVGRKYYTCYIQNGQFTREIKFRLDDNLELTEMSPVRKAYFSEQEYYDEQEHLRLLNQLRGCFDWRHKVQFTLEQLRQVCQILKLTTGESDTAEGG